MKFNHLFALPFFLIFMTTCSAQGVPQPTPGFLTDYTRLTPALSSINGAQTYTAPDASGHPLGRVYIQPLVSYPDSINFEYIDRATMAALQSQFNAALATELQKQVILVSTPELADTILKMAVTGVTADVPRRKPRDLLPLKLITNPIKNATEGKQQEVLVTIEMKILNVKSNKIIFESLARAKGKTMGRTGDEDLHADIKELEPVIDTWTNKISKWVSALQTNR
jgi:hypothetical protein